MALTRRRLLVNGSLTLAAGAIAPALSFADQKQSSAPDFSSWSAVRREFDIDPQFIHLGLFYLTSHPRVVREAIESYRKKLDFNPFITVEHGLFESDDDNMPLKVTRALAGYTGASADDFALTSNTTTGLALAYHGLPLKKGDEVLTTDQDHVVHHEAIRLATERVGATWRRIPLFDSYETISADGIVDRIRKAIRPATRVVGVTWVHSSSGLRLPISRIGDAVAEANRNRAAGERILLVVDGVHGLGVENPNIPALNCDVLSAGTHKWLFGPRGTGFLWARPEVWATMRPTIPSFTSAELYDAWSEERPPKGPARANWFSPGGFLPFEHHWAVPAAVEFHQKIGPARITERIHELNRQFKNGLNSMKHVRRLTPMSDELSAGMVVFDVNGMKPADVTKRLLEKKIIATTTPYAITHPRVAFGILNNEDEVKKTLAAVAALG